MVTTRKIECCECGKRGEIEIIGLKPEDAFNVFRYLGHHAFSGDLYFRCPACKCELIVNPMEALGPGIIKGLPKYAMQLPTWHYLGKYFQIESNASEKQ